DYDPIWSPDGARVAFSSDRKGHRDVYVKNALGTGEDELLVESSQNKSVEDWSRDGRFLVFNVSVPGRGLDVWLYSFANHQARPLLETASVENQARFSPDGHWLAYSSNETGQNEVYICALTEAGVRGKWVVSTGGGIEPQWRGDSKELFYATRAAPARI